jgi:hypothetical protein
MGRASAELWDLVEAEHKSESTLRIYLAAVKQLVETGARQPRRSARDDAGDSYSVLRCHSLTHLPSTPAVFGWVVFCFN